MKLSGGLAFFCLTTISFNGTEMLKNLFIAYVYSNDLFHPVSTSRDYKVSTAMVLGVNTFTFTRPGFLLPDVNHSSSHQPEVGEWFIICFQMVQVREAMKVEEKIIWNEYCVCSLMVYRTWWYLSVLMKSLKWH